MLPSWVKAEWLIHFKAFSFIDRWSTCHWAERRQWVKCYLRYARLQWNCFTKSWSVLFAACSESILRTWPKSHWIHPASAGTGRCRVWKGAHLWHGAKQLMSGVKGAWQKETNFCLTKFPLCYCIKKYNSFHALKNVHVRQILS